MITILIILLVIVAIGSLPTYSYSADWTYYPSGFLTILVIVLIVWLLMGHGSAR